MSESIRVVIADDHPIVLDGLEQLFSLEPDLEVVARCQNGDAALEAVREHDPEVLVLDLRMPQRGGLGVIRTLRDEKRDTRVVVLTAALAEDEVFEAVQLGAKGVVLKDMAPTLLLDCVRQVAAGGDWLDHEVTRRALERASARGGGSTVSSLTPRELEIVRLVAEGLRNKEIAERLSISEGTVKIHLHSIYEKLQIGGRVELSVFARDRGLV